ncbi:MAG: hypothetical protein U0359_35635 [Byssovorax sp.]
MNIGDFTLDLSPPAVDAPLRFEAAPDELPFPRGVRAVVREALIPFIVWSSVPVRVFKPRQLGRMEAFLLETCLTLGHFTLRELERAISVPAAVIASSATRLLAHGTLIEGPTGEYFVDEDQAAGIIATKNIREVHAESMTFVYFPRQDEVTADPELTAQLSRIDKKLRAPRRAPWPAHLDRAEGVADFLASRITAGRISGAAHEILALDAWAKPPPWPDLSPCYFGRGHVLGEGTEAFAELDIWGHERKKAARGQYSREKLKLGKGSPLLQEWIALADQFGVFFKGTANRLPSFVFQQLEPFAPCQWRAGVSDADAGALARDRWLTDALPISVCSSTAKVDVRLSLEPTSARGADMFAIDAMAQQAVAGDNPFSAAAFSDHERLARERFPLAAPNALTRARVEERLWAMKRFMTTYTLRAREDFAYG